MCGIVRKEEIPVIHESPRQYSPRRAESRALRVSECRWEGRDYGRVLKLFNYAPRTHRNDGTRKRKGVEE